MLLDANQKESVEVLGEIEDKKESDETEKEAVKENDVSEKSLDDPNEQEGKNESLTVDEIKEVNEETIKEVKEAEFASNEKSNYRKTVDVKTSSADDKSLEQEESKGMYTLKRLTLNYF